MKGEYKKLIEEAQKVARYKKISHDTFWGETGSAILTEKGKIFVGISISSTAVGLCGEQSAIINMIINSNETKIKAIVAISENGKILPPCGQCREFIYAINKANLDTDVIIGREKVVKLRHLLPERWQEKFKGYFK